MVALNKMSRYHLAGLVIRYGMRDGDRATALHAELKACLDAAARYAREHFEDPPEIADWVWTDPADRD